VGGPESGPTGTPLNPALHAAVLDRLRFAAAISAHCSLIIVADHTSTVVGLSERRQLFLLLSSCYTAAPRPTQVCQSLSSVGLLNVRSLCHKAALIDDVIAEDKVRQPCISNPRRPPSGAVEITLSTSAIAVSLS
jgi:hypothetical protein